MMDHPSTQTSALDDANADPSLRKALLCARAAIDKKAQNLKILDLREFSSFTEYFIVCSGTSDRHVQTIADSASVELREEKIGTLSTEGYSEGRWVLMDLGDVVLHVFLDPLREYYDLERLWADAPRVPIPSEFYGPGASRLN